MKFQGLVLASALLANSLFAQNISVSNNWQLLGAVEDINTTVFDNSGCVDFVWKYNNGWKVHITNGQDYRYVGDTFLYLNKGEGFWIKGNKNCNFNNSKNNAETIFNSDGSITFNGKIYYTIKSNRTNKIWLDRNIGASEVCKNESDKSCFGGYFQWGRMLNGHELPSSEISNIILIQDSFVNNKFIVSHDNWEKVFDDSLWNINSKNKVCPEGFRLPTMKEFQDEYIDETATISPKYTTFDYDILKLPFAGMRLSKQGNFFQSGEHGYYWTITKYSSTNVDGNISYSNIKILSIRNYKAYCGSVGAVPASGLSVRCIKK